MKRPPLGDSHWPVKKELSSDARKSAVVATSSGSAHRPRGVRATTAARMRSDTPWVIGVSMNPGQIALTRIFRDPTSRATARVKPRMPALAAL